MNSNYVVYALLEGGIVRDLYLGIYGLDEANTVASIRYIDGIAVNTDGRFVKAGDKFLNGEFYSLDNGEWKVVRRESGAESDGSQKVIEKQKARIDYLEKLLADNNIKL